MIRRYGFSSTRMLFAGGVALVGAVASSLTVAQAAPLLLGKGATATSHVLLVRDGCGQGMRYSGRRGGCVEDFDGGPRGYYEDRGPPPPPMYDRRPPPPEYDRRPPPPPEYSRRPDRGDSDVAAGAIIGGAVGALIGSSIRNDGDQQVKVVRPVR